MSRILTDGEVTTLEEDAIAWSGLVPKGYEEITYGLVDLALGSKTMLLNKVPSAAHNIVSIKYATPAGQQPLLIRDIKVHIEKLSKNNQRYRHVIELKDADILAEKNTYFFSELNAIELKQLDRKFKHAVDFDIITTKKNAETINQFEAAIKNHMNDISIISHGTYGFMKDSRVFFNPNTNNVVVLDKFGNFVTGFKLVPGTSQYENYMKNGVLR
ncbi:colicin D domain-containing protein [Orbaceae bacterium ESL0721]|nr:colicin D domain-containing protein [Orbaceae bacterium ESL0721]